jgi:hypothetical protein
MAATYAQGIYGKTPAQDKYGNAVGTLSFRKAEFIEWAEQQEVNEQGFFRLYVNRQKNNPDKFSFVVAPVSREQSAPESDDMPF